MDWDLEDDADDVNWDDEWERGEVFWHNDMITTSDLFPFIELD